MISKDRIFRKGDVIVSGWGNIRILVGETGDGVAKDGAKDVFYDALTMYCDSDAPAGTDMRYARHATEKEKKMFFGILKANGLVYDAKTCTIKAGENYKGAEAANFLARRNSKGPQPFKVVKKRVRPTLCQIRLLEESCKKLTDKNNVLEQSNNLMEEELNRKNEACNSLADQLAEKNTALAKLMNRGFFARLFNLK